MVCPSFYGHRRNCWSDILLKGSLAYFPEEILLNLDTVCRIRTFGDRAFSVPTLQNALPAYIRNSSSLDTFKILLKHYLVHYSLQPLLTLLPPTNWCSSHLLTGLIPLHFEVSLAKIQNPNNCALSAGRHFAWQAPPSVFECMYKLL